MFRPSHVIAAAVLLVAATGAVFGYRRWCDYRSNEYKLACREAIRNESWQQLETIASRWIAWEPASDDGWVFLSEASVKLGRTERAAEALGRVSDSYHGALEALAVRGEILFADLNRPAEAAATWQRMLQIDPRADLAHQRLIYYYSMTLRRPEMLEQIRQAMELHCEPPEAYAYFLLAYDLNFSDGLNVVTKWLENYPDDEVLEVARAIYVAKYSPSKAQAMFGQSAVAPGDLTLLNACRAKYPQNLEILAFDLDYAIYDGDEERVLRLLKDCPQAAEQDPRFWRCRGWYLAAHGLHAEAERALRKSLELHPPSWRTWLMLASVLRQLQHAEAGKAAEIALVGKELERDLFELPTARALDNDLGIRIQAYLRQTGPKFASEALARRL